MKNNPEIVVDLPRSNAKIICQKYSNDNWKLYFQNKDNNSIKPLERSFSTIQMKETILFLITSASQHGIYKNAHEAFQIIKSKINSIKEDYVQTKNV
jgi:hypothetical protein